MTDILYSAVECYEEFESRTEEYDEDSGWKMSVKLRCASDDRFALVDDLIANKRQWPHGALGVVPIALGCGIEPPPIAYTVYTGGQVINYPEALVTVRYGLSKGEDLVTESIEPNVEFNLLDYRRFNWTGNTGDQLLEGEAPGKEVFSAYLVRTLYKVDSIPSIILSGIGKVNDATYTSALLGGLAFPAETLLLCPQPIERTFKSDGNVAMNLTVKFAFRPDGWNKYWRSKTSSYESIYEKASASIYKSYPTADLSSLLF